MIQRFCFVKLHDGEVTTRGELAARLAARLGEAGGDAVVGLPADDSAARWDLSIVITAASLAAWNALSRTPAMIGFDELARRAAVVKAWTFAAVEAAAELNHDLLGGWRVVKDRAGTTSYARMQLPLPA